MLKYVSNLQGGVLVSHSANAIQVSMFWKYIQNYKAGDYELQSEQSHVEQWLHSWLLNTVYSWAPWRSVRSGFFKVGPEVFVLNRLPS